MRNVWDLVIVIGLLLFLAALVWPMVPQRASEETRRKACNSNLTQIVKTMATYQEPNGDFFPAHSQYFTGRTDDFKPMPSRAVLYPAYIDDAKVFRCDFGFVQPQLHGASRGSSLGNHEALPTGRHKSVSGKCRG